MPYIYLTQWEWKQDPETRQFAWDSPNEDAIGRYDLRSYAQAGLKGTQEGFGLFVYDAPQTIPNALFLGDDPTALLKLEDRRAIETLYQLAGDSLPSGSLMEIVALALKGTLADKNGGSTGPLPLLMPGSGRDINIRIGGLGTVYTEPFSNSNQRFLDTMAHHRAIYRRKALAGTPQQVLERWTGARMLRWWGKLDNQYLDLLVPADEFPTHGYRHPGTQYEDTFVDTAGTNLDAHTPTGSSPASGWSMISGASGDIDILSGNIAGTTAFGAHKRAVITDSLGDDSHWAEAVINASETSNFGLVGMVVAYDSSGPDHYRFEFRTNAGRIRIFRNAGGSDTLLATDNTPSMTLGSVGRLEFDGGDFLEVFDDGVSDLSVTDGTPITGGLQPGITAWKDTTGNVNWDSFLCDDGISGGFPHSQAVIIG